VHCPLLLVPGRPVRAVVSLARCVGAQYVGWAYLPLITYLRRRAGFRAGACSLSRPASKRIALVMGPPAPEFGSAFAWAWGEITRLQLLTQGHGASLAGAPAGPFARVRVRGLLRRALPLRANHRSRILPVTGLGRRRAVPVALLCCPRPPLLLWTLPPSVAPALALPRPVAAATASLATAAAAASAADAASMAAQRPAKAETCAWATSAST